LPALVGDQGDKIGRFFADWATVYFNAVKMMFEQILKVFEWHFCSWQLMKECHKNVMKENDKYVNA
jgi:hypothetical protein